MNSLSSMVRTASSRVTSSAAASCSPACPPPAIHTRRSSWAQAPLGASTGRPNLHRCNRAIVCMAHPRRVARVASQIQREIGDMFVSDPVIQAAICPERRLGDDSLSAVASITDTYVSNDLQVVKVYVSVYSDEYGKRTAIENLQRLESYVRRQIGQRVQLRLTPEVRFVYDDSEEEADLVARVIGREEVERYRQELEAEMLGQPAAGRKEATGKDGEGADGEEEEDEDEDEYEYDDDEENDPDLVPQTYPDPFADMFSAEGPEPMGRATNWKGAAAGGRGGRRGGRGGRGRGQQGQRRKAGAGGQQRGRGPSGEGDGA